MMDALIAWFEQVNQWVSPVADALNAPIWAVAGLVWALGAGLLGWLASRALRRRVDKVEDETAQVAVETQALARRVEDADVDREEIKRSVDETKALTERVLSQLRALAPPDYDPASAEAIEHAVERLAASSDARKQAALQKAAEGDLAGAVADLELLGEQQRNATDMAKAQTAETFKEAGALAFNSDSERALRNYEAALALAPNDAEVVNQLGNLYYRLGRLDEAEAAYRSLRDASDGDDVLRAIALGNLGLVSFTRGDLEAAEDLHTQALALNETMGRVEGQAVTLGNLGNVARARNNLDAAHDFQTRSLALNEQLGNLEGQAADLCNLGLVAKARGDLDAAEELHNRAIDLAKQAGSVDVRANNILNLGSIAQTRDDKDGAEALYSRALALYRQLGHVEGRATSLANLGAVANERGDQAKACAYWAQAKTLFETVGVRPKLEQLEGWMAEANCDSV